MDTMIVSGINLVEDYYKYIYVYAYDFTCIIIFQLHIRMYIIYIL